jgi:hypothetical protein
MGRMSPQGIRPGRSGCSWQSQGFRWLGKKAVAYLFPTIKKLAYAGGIAIAGAQQGFNLEKLAPQSEKWIAVLREDLSCVRDA